VESADEMYDEVVRLFPSCDVVILCAAVADYKPEHKASEKIKREQNDVLTIPLVRNKDIAAVLGKEKQSHQMLVGFALETKDEITHAKDKLQRKNLDVIVLNSLNDKGAGFGYDTNKVTLIDKYGLETNIPLKSKTEIAEEIIDYLVKSMVSII
jgi:phosphopantothenoylcysteine decarboxylase/phosphopantothenate--cysteine ligase